MNRCSPLPLTVLLFIMLITGCRENDQLYARAGAWVRENTASDATIFTLEPRRAQGYIPRELVSTSSVSAFETTFKELEPDYCLVTPHLAWELVKYQSHFQESYVPMHTITIPKDFASPLTIFAYAPLREYRGEYRPVYEYDIGDCIHLIAYELDTTVIMPEEPLTARIIWRVSNPIPHPNLGIAVRLTHQQDELYRTRVYEEKFDGRRVSAWAAGDVITSTHQISIPHNFPPGRYSLEAAMFKTFMPAPLPPRARQVAYPFKYEDWWLRMALITARSAFQPPTATAAPIAVWDGSIELVGYALPETIHSGDVVPVNLFWRARDDISTDYTIFVHLIAPSEQPRAQHDSYPQNGLYPTSQWYSRDFVSDTHQLSLPPETPSGEYAVWVGMYDLETMTRLNVSSETAYVENNAVKLQDVVIP